MPKKKSKNGKRPPTALNALGDLAEDPEVQEVGQRSLGEVIQLELAAFCLRESQGQREEQRERNIKRQAGP